MRKSILFFCIFLISLKTFCQSDLLWKGYFSYNEIKDLSESSTKVLAASENALFSKDLSTSELKTFNTIDGLSGETITAVYFSKLSNKTLVGYQNGLVIVINEFDKSIFKAIGIIQKQIPTNVKKVNSFYEHNGIAYISCGFGIVQFKLINNEFGDTYFLGSTLLDYQEVFQTTVLNNSIYAVTRNNGIKKGDLVNPNLNDFSQWSIFDAGYWSGIATLNNQIVASNSNNSLYKFIGNIPTLFFTTFSQIKDFRVFENNLTVTNANNVYVFNDQLINTSSINNSSIDSVLPPIFTCASFLNNTVYIGTFENGLLTTTLNNPTIFNNITPNGPIRNAIFAMNATPNKLWVSYGGYNLGYNPYEYNFLGLNQYGISKYDENGWNNKLYSELLGAKSICKIATNPDNPNQIFFSSFASGLLKVENEIPTILYNKTNSALTDVEDAVGLDLIKINGVAFDKTGNLWLTNSRTKNAIKVLKKDNTWQLISVAPLEVLPNDFKNCDYNNIVIDKNNTKWIASSYLGVVAYNENGNILKKVAGGVDNGNLPSRDARVVALDNKNQLWIGTTSGLRIISSVDSFLNPGQINSTNIVIEEDGIGQELLYEQHITDIVVDGANRKWVGTLDSGVFLISPNGQKTIYHFTIDDSPLPSNLIFDIDIDPKTGEVFIATEKGMISFRGVSTKGNENLDNVYVYPNPVRPNYNDTVKVSGLLDKATVKITDIEGSLVFETTSEGGTIEWDTTAFGKYKVASGVYMVFVSSQDGLETKVNKVMIIR